jgi:diacylglycerol kinase family enzyme
MFRRSSSELICILNATAGSRRAAGERRTLEKLFADNGQKVRIILARGGAGIVRHAKDAVAKCPMVIAAGGDGTISAVAAIVQGTNTALGVLPIGTLNHFAKDLNIPLTLPEAVANLFNGVEAQVDVGEVNGEIFINNSSLGFYPGVVQVRETLQKSGHGKWPAFVRAFIRVFRRASPLSVRLTGGDDIDDKSTTTPFVFVGNNRYELEAANAGKRLSLQEGKLYVYQAPHAGRWKLVGIALRSLFGWRSASDLDIVSAQEFWIRTRASRIRVANDGEVINLSPPLHYRSLPGALRVIVPAPTAPPAPEQ